MAYGVRTARQLASATGASQPTISRALKGMEGVVQLGRGPSTSYGLASSLGESGSAWPLYLIDPSGDPGQVGRLHRLAGEAWWLESDGRWPSLLTGEFKAGIFPGLPWFLDDARPQGFLGRAFARKYGSSLGLGNNPANWSNAAVAESLLRFGDDLPGAFVLGRDALSHALAGRDIAAVEVSERERLFPKLAEAVLSGEVTGSSAGGEQPKFSAVVPVGGRLDHVLVKFSPSRTTPEGQRWADLLATEMLAVRTLEDKGFETPRVEVLDFADRRYLQVSRFDRTTAGRVPVVSLRAVDAAFLALLHAPWSAAAEKLQEAGWIGQADAERLASLGNFGRLIHNTDMHFGNVSLILSPRLPARLAPVYDMLPMGYRPGLEGRLPGFSEAALPLDHEWPQHEWALHFWDVVATSDLISEDFRRIAELHRKALSQAVRLRQA